MQPTRPASHAQPEGTVPIEFGGQLTGAGTAATYDVVLSRHVLWALPDPVEALRRWSALLRPEGRLVLVEGDGRGDELPLAERVPLHLDTLGAPCPPESACVSILPEDAPRSWSM